MPGTVSADLTRAAGPAVAVPAQPWWQSRSELVFAAWVLFAAACVVLVATFSAVGVIAFHVVWVSMSVVYGIQGWSPRRTALVLVVVLASTTVAMAAFIRAEGADWMELTEVPLMAGVFLAMVWHVRRRAAALAESLAAAERERRAHELKELFVRNCSHEMRTPITVARGYAELVRGQVQTDGAREDVDVVVDELDKLGGLATRLLQLADAYEAEHFEWGQVDLDGLARRTVQRWRPAADRDWQLDSVPVVVEGDESRLEAALDSLVENALKFTSDGDMILVRCAPTNDGADLVVEDSGVGFAASRRGDTRASGRPGTGLGLAIVKAVAEAHGGGTELRDRAGGGSVVTLRVARHRPAATAARQDVSAPAPG
jgi:two-component system, OmpR family, sensor kinase